MVTPRLKQLELIGYKTFANKTAFLFPNGGITAIVGPNGSGKSNIADALRWVLGEQSFQVLRGKRSEDMIFAGNKHRPRVGMAQVTVTLDNSDHWLPTDFGEVTISRRAYRSGENEYFLNGKRVRLKEIADLLAQTGLARRTYTVIGQGLVDRVLSLRPEERRSLFEEAAGVSIYQQRRKASLAQLNETRANLIRLHDILSEITPQLKRLERQAERARKKELLEASLKELHQVWYGYQWSRVVAQVKQQETVVNMWRQRVSKRQEAVQRQEEVIDQLQETLAGKRDALRQWHQRRSVIHRRAEELQNQLSVISEQRRLAFLRREELTSELAPLKAHADGLRQKLSVALADQRALMQRLVTTEATLAKHRQEKSVQESRRKDVEMALQEGRQAVLRATAELAKVRQQQARVRQQIDEAVQAAGEQQATLTTLAARVADNEKKIAEYKNTLTALQQAVDEEQERLREGEEVIRQAEEETTVARHQLDKCRLAVQALRQQRENLVRLREDGAGLYNGVREVVKAAQKQQLSGVVGVVGELLRVPSELEKAIEVALGSSLQDVVVQRWVDAEAAIQLLKQRRAGRATFLPLDTIRPPHPERAPGGNGVIGIASDLVESAPQIAPAVQLLLSRTLVVKEMAAARKVLSHARYFRIVTVAGELVRSNGRVTGGQEKHQRGGMLAREREWRELPVKIEEALRQQTEAERRFRQANETVSAAKRALPEAQQRLLSAQQAVAHTEQQVEHAVAELTALRRERQWRQEEKKRLRANQQRWTQDLRHAEEQEASGRERLQQAEDQVRALEADLASGEMELLQRQLMALEKEIALLQGRKQDQESFIANMRVDIERQETLIAQKETRLEELEAEIAQVEADIAAKSDAYRHIQEDLAVSEAPIPQLEAEIKQLQEEQRRSEQEEQRLQRQLHSEEERLNRALLAYQRESDRREHLQKEIREHMGLVSFPGDGVPTQEALPLENVLVLSSEQELPPGLEKDLKRVRVQLRQVGHVDPEVIQEYDALQQRYSFLRLQVNDLEEAIHNLNSVISSLDETMEQKFLETFKRAAKRFPVYFKELFDGGSARITLSNPDAVNESGIEVHAHPPSKRPQTLALLSGGERALTAAALLFSILDVSPPPFCVLDEVDAALDEANAVRFRTHLERLSERTQFIVVTHNRSTAEAANTIYGITLGKDGTSQVLSLSLAETSKMKNQA